LMTRDSDLLTGELLRETASLNSNEGSDAFFTLYE
jgi:hypothetical protein